jgi:predicted amidohydrolase YtcJ
VTLWAAVTDPRPGALTAAEALTAISSGSARAVGLGEGERPHGCLEVGCVADLTVFDADPTAVAPDALSELQTVTRYLGGVELR